MGVEVSVQYGVSLLDPMRMTLHEPARLAVESKCRGSDEGKLIVNYYQKSI